MSASPVIKGGCMFSCVFMLLGAVVHAQDADAVLGSAKGWQRYDWLSPTDEQAGKLTASASHDIGDPFAVVTRGSLFQEKYGVTYSRPLLDNVALSYQTTDVALQESSLAPTLADEGVPDDLSHGQKALLQFQPEQQLSFTGNVHDSTNDDTTPEDSVATRGAGLTAEGHLPLNSTLTLGLNSDKTTTGNEAVSAIADNSYDAQLKAPLGKLPVTAVLKGHYEETTQDGATATRLPSMEQSLVWKAGDAATVQMGLRQQHYQSFPGMSNDLNETIFADWSQNLLPEVTWHSYAEVLNSRDTLDLAPAAPTTTGANGTPQSADPTNSLGLPTSITDEAVSFSTGPSIKLDQDVSASIEYSNRVNRNPQPGTVETEQRVSVSLKGTF
jgi:hypothetical protein